MIKPSYKTPCARPREGLEIKVAYIVQGVCLASGEASNNEKLIIVDHSSMSGSAFRYGSPDLRLCPVRGAKIEYHKVGEILPVLVLTTIHQKLVPFP